MSQPDRIRAYRRQFWLSQHQLGASLGVHYMTISRYERAEVVPPVMFWLALEELARRLNRQRRKEAKQKERLNRAPK